MFAVCSPSAAMLARNIKLLAHDNKLRAGCLLILAAVQPAGLGPAQLCCGNFNIPDLVCVGCACSDDCHIGIFSHPGFDREQHIRQDA